MTSSRFPSVPAESLPASASAESPCASVLARVPARVPACSTAVPVCPRRPSPRLPLPPPSPLVPLSPPSPLVPLFPLESPPAPPQSQSVPARVPACSTAVPSVLVRGPACPRRSSRRTPRLSRRSSDSPSPQLNPGLSLAQSDSGSVPPRHLPWSGPDTCLGRPLPAFAMVPIRPVAVPTESLPSFPYVVAAQAAAVGRPHPSPPTKTPCPG